ncbi:hydroxyethylthiazole kinase [Cellulomonas sp. NPDC057328]|uniref:hydroxyethylthiazole kinase n=1 Tax=Cellulomonas sp. NPDC057328 TaxID=3346101 RepID=UPI0036299099
MTTPAVPCPPEDLAARAGLALDDLRARTPLVQCLTNEVTTNLVANALLAIGASPAMASAPGEAEELAAVAGAVLVNLGTLGPDQRAAVAPTVAVAAGAGTPWVLDPVAVGVLSVRTRLAARLVAERPAVVRGNASEVRALAGLTTAGRGVDAGDEVDAAAEAADALALRTGGAVAVSGPVDLVTDGRTRVRLAVGDRLLTTVTGAGCALGGLVAAFAAVTDPLTAGAGASTALGVAAERAAQVARGPGSFVPALLDELHALTGADLAERLVVAARVAVPA